MSKCQMGMKILPLYLLEQRNSFMYVQINVLNEDVTTIARVTGIDNTTVRIECCHECQLEVKPNNLRQIKKIKILRLHG